MSTKIRKQRFTSRFRQSAIFWAALAAVIAFLVHFSYLSNGFTWLDHIDIERQNAILPISDGWHAFFSRYAQTGFYRPLVTLAHSFDFALWGLHAPGYHLTNVMLHSAVSAAALFFFMEFMALSPAGAFAGAVVVAVHPLSWLPVGAISYRPELLLTLFLLLTVVLHAKARKSGKTGPGLLAILFFFLALCAKETAAVWGPGLILLWEWQYSRHNKQANMSNLPSSSAATFWPPAVRSFGWLWAGELASLLMYAFLRLRAVPDIWHATPVSLPLSEMLGTRLAALGKQMLWLVSPLKPGLSDATAVVSIFSPAALLATGVLIAIALLAYRGRLSTSWETVFLFLGLAWLPVLNIVPLPRFNSPHYGYFASLGLGLALPAGWHAVQKPKLARHLFAGVTGLWLLVMTTVTFTSGRQFKNDYTLFQPEIEKDPDFLEAQYYLGDYFMKKRSLQKAARAYAAALHENPKKIAYVDRPAALINLAGVRIRQGRLEDGEQLLKKAAALAPEDRQPLIAYNLATIAARRKDFKQVIALLARPGYTWQRPEPLLLLAQAYRHTGQTQEALATLTKTLPLLSPAKRRKLQQFIESQSDQ